MPEEATVEATEATTTAVSSEMEKVITYIENLTLLEAKKLADALKERLGVSDAAPMMMAGVMPAAGGAAAEEEEKTEFDVVLTGFGDKKIGVIKEVRAITGLGLKEAKDLVEGCPKPIKEGVSKDEAQQLKAKLEEAGATVELK